MRGSDPMSHLHSSRHDVEW